MANDQEPDKVVTITLDASGSPVPSINPVPVRKNKQKIKWCSDFQFTITIDGYTEIKYGSGDGSAFNAKTGHFPAEQTHKYSITANGVTNDPEIDVKP
jgi:hypothetical protein